MPLDILHVVPYAPAAWAHGGIPRVVGGLVAGLARRGHRLTVVATDAGDAHARLASTCAAAPESSGVRTLLFPNLSNALAYQFQFFTPRGLSAWLGRHAGDFAIAHIHGCHHLPGVLAAHALHRAGVPHVVQPNGTAPLSERRRLWKWLLDRTAGDGGLTTAARVLAVSAAEERDLFELGVGAERSLQLPNPVVIEEFSPIPARDVFRHRHGIPEAAALVLFLGRATPRKRVDLLVEAFLGLSTNGSASPWLAIAGNDGGGLAAARRLLARERRVSTRQRVVVTGLLRGPERIEALAAADVVVYPSQGEVFGLVPLEALLCGTPVIVSDGGGCGETVASVGGGLLFRDGDAVALGGAMTAVLAAPDVWSQAARAAAVRVRSRFSADVIAERLEAIYLEVLGATT